MVDIDSVNETNVISKSMIWGYKLKPKVIYATYNVIRVSLYNIYIYTLNNCPTY